MIAPALPLRDVHEKITVLNDRHLQHQPHRVPEQQAPAQRHQNKHRMLLQGVNFGN
jgi:hypothetical protein